MTTTDNRRCSCGRCAVLDAQGVVILATLACLALVIFP
jgi:hypothetical protein